MTETGSAYSLILGRKVQGTPVFNPTGERIGHIEDVSIHKVSGQVIYAILSFGGFLGLGEKYHPVPWSVLTYNTSLGGYVIPLSKAALDSAPSYALGELADPGEDNDQRYREPVFGYYGEYGAQRYWL